MKSLHDAMKILGAHPHQLVQLAARSAMENGALLTRGPR
jgi:hypothetical protein